MIFFELIFIDHLGGQTTIEIENEPIGYDGATFVTKRDEGRHGTDVIFIADEDIAFEFTEHAHPEVFSLLENYYLKYGFEANVKLKITDNNESFIGNLGFDGIEYNGYDSIKLNVFQETEQGLIKKRSSTKVDLFGDKDLDGKPSEPAPTQNILLKSKELFLTSVWENLTPSILTPTIPNQFALGFNKSFNNTKYEIPSSIYAYDFSQFPPTVTDSTLWTYQKEFKLIDSKSDLTNVKVKIEVNDSFYSPNSTSTSPDYAKQKDILIKYRVGADPNNRSEFESNTSAVVFPYEVKNNNRYLKNYEFIIPRIRTGEGFWLWFQSGALYPNYFNYNNIKITIEANSLTFDTVTKAVSVYDAISKITRDTSGMGVSFPIAQTGYLKNNFIFNGNHVRGINDEFKLSFDDIINWFPELNLDYEIQSNNTIFIGDFRSFYTDTEIRVFDNVTLDGYNISTNLDFTNNEFSYKYEDYQANNENPEDGSKETIHGEAIYLINNKQVESKKDVTVGFARDSFLLEKKRRDAVIEKESTSASNDDTVFILDAEALPNTGKTLVKSSFLFHILGTHEGEEVLILRNDGSFRFDILGLYEVENNSLVTSNFYIGNGVNQGYYAVRKIFRNELFLARIGSGAITSAQELFTEFTYELNQNVSIRPYYNNSAYVSGITSQSTFINIEFSIKANILRGYSEFLKTCNLYKNEAIKLTEYKHNRVFTKISTNSSIILLEEGADIEFLLPKNVILDTKKVETKIIMTLGEYFSLCNTVRSGNKGFIRTFSPKGDALYIYPDEMLSERKSSDLEEVNISGKLRYLPDDLNIIKSGGLYMIFTHSLVNKNYEVFDEEIQFYDDNNLPIFKKLLYSSIRLNNISYSSLNAFIIALQNF